MTTPDLTKVKKNLRLYLNYRQLCEILCDYWYYRGQTAPFGHTMDAFTELLTNRFYYRNDVYLAGTRKKAPLSRDLAYRYAVTIKNCFRNPPKHILAQIIALHKELDGKKDPRYDDLLVKKIVDAGNVFNEHGCLPIAAAMCDMDSYFTLLEQLTMRAELNGQISVEQYLRNTFSQSAVQARRYASGQDPIPYGIKAKIRSYNEESRVKQNTVYKDIVVKWLTEKLKTEETIIPISTPPSCESIDDVINNPQNYFDIWELLEMRALLNNNSSVGDYLKDIFHRDSCIIAKYLSKERSLPTDIIKQVYSYNERDARTRYPCYIELITVRYEQKNYKTEIAKKAEPLRLTSYLTQGTSRVMLGDIVRDMDKYFDIHEQIAIRAEIVGLSVTSYLKQQFGFSRGLAFSTYAKDVKVSGKVKQDIASFNAANRYSSDPVHKSFIKVVAKHFAKKYSKIEDAPTPPAPSILCAPDKENTVLTKEAWEAIVKPYLTSMNIDTRYPKGGLGLLCGDIKVKTDALNKTLQAAKYLLSICPKGY